MDAYQSTVVFVIHVCILWMNRDMLQYTLDVVLSWTTDHKIETL